MFSRRTRILGLVLVAAVALTVTMWSRHRSALQSGGEQLTARQRQEIVDGINANMAQFNRDKRDVAAIFADAVRVEPIRLDEYQKHQKFGDVGGFPIVRRAATQDKAFAKELGDVILDGRTYAEPGRSLLLCWFMPDVAFRVIDSEGRSADVLITIQCKNLIVIENNKKIPLQGFCGSGEDKWRFRVGGDFIGPMPPHMVEVTPEPKRDPVKRIFDLIRRAFPEDKKLLQAVSVYESK